MQQEISKKMLLICFEFYQISVFHFKNSFHPISKSRVHFSLVRSSSSSSHHFGYQCKVQTYGFSRLIDLLEELSHVVKVKSFKSTEEKI